MCQLKYCVKMDICTSPKVAIDFIVFPRRPLTWLTTQKHQILQAQIDHLQIFDTRLILLFMICTPGQFFELQQLRQSDQNLTLCPQDFCQTEDLDYI